MESDCPFSLIYGLSMVGRALFSSISLEVCLKISHKQRIIQKIVILLMNLDIITRARRIDQFIKKKFGYLLEQVQRVLANTLIQVKEILFLTLHSIVIEAYINIRSLYS